MHMMNMDSERGGGSGCESEESNKIDVKDRSRKGEKVCRICHFAGKGIISLGCDCKGELGCCHRHCADIWFTHKGDIVCEICGKRAKNVGNNAEEEITMFMIEMREMGTSLEASGESKQRCSHCFCHWLLACFILLFMLLWFFRGINIL